MRWDLKPNFCSDCGVRIDYFRLRCGPCNVAYAKRVAAKAKPEYCANCSASVGPAQMRCRACHASPLKTTKTPVVKQAPKPKPLANNCGVCGFRPVATGKGVCVICCGSLVAEVKVKSVADSLKATSAFASPKMPVNGIFAHPQRCISCKSPNPQHYGYCASCFAAASYGTPVSLPPIATKSRAEAPATTKRPSWDDYFFGMAKLVSTRATCPRASVGVVLVDSKHRVISTGYNGARSGEPHCVDVGCDIFAGHCQRARHAEESAIDIARELECLDHDDAPSVAFLVTYDAPVTAYVYGPQPVCTSCSRIMRAAGVSDVKWRS